MYKHTHTHTIANRPSHITNHTTHHTHTTPHHTSHAHTRAHTCAHTHTHPIQLGKCDSDTMMTKDEFKECIRCFLFGGRLNRRLHLYIAADDFSRFVWYEQPGDRRAPSHADLRFGYENEEPAEEEEEEVVDSINGEQLVYATIYTPLSTREGRKRNFLDIANFKNLLSGFVCQFAQGTGHRQLVLVMCRSPNVLPKTMTGWRVLHQPLLIWSDEIQASASFFALGLQGGGPS